MLYIIIAIKGQTEILREIKINFDLAIIIIIIKKENIIINFTNHQNHIFSSIKLRVLNNPLAFDHSGLQRIPINAIYTLR